MRPCVQVTVTMNAKDLRTESAPSERNNDGSKYSHSGGTAVHCDRNKSYQDIGSNSLAKVDIQPARPCAVIGPDRIVPPPAQNEAFVKRGPGEPWPCTDNAYYGRRPPEYPHKLANLQNPTRNISPRQTFQENMQRVMVPPTYNSVKLSDDSNYAQMLERGNALSKNIKMTVPQEAKFCDVPYNVYPPSNEQKNIRNPELCNVNSNIIRTAPPVWSSSNVNIRPRTYGASELYQYPEYASCAGPRPVVHQPNRTVPEDPGYVYADQFYHQEGNIRYKPYPTVKERFPQQRYDYIGNYANSFHPTPVFPTHKYEMQKPVPPHSYAPYPPIKYVDRGPESVLEGYQRNQQGSYNIPYCNQIIHPNYRPVPGNNPQNKIHSYPPDALIKPGGPNKLPFDNTKAYIEYENGRPKMYPPSESYLVNEMGRTHTMKSQVIMPNYPTLNMHNVPPNSYYKKDSQYVKNYEYMQAHYRSIDPNFNPMLRHQPVFSPSTLAISPTDSTASNDISQTLGPNQDDCGYVSQSSTASGRSMDSGIHRIPNDYYVRKYYDNRYIRGPGPPVISKAELNTNNHSKDKKNIDVRQFLQMWNEGDEEAETNNSKEIVIQVSSKNDSNYSKAHEVLNQPNQEQLYVLGLVNVPSEELGKYEHIQKVSKLPENIKGYNHIDLLKQFEQVTESSNMSGYAVSSKDFQTQLKGFLTKPPTGVVPPRPLSPLDVEAKISQSVIHKEVGCNFEIKPCSPKMLNVEVATPVQNMLERERAIQKVANPGMLKSPRINSIDENIDCNIMKRKDHRINTNNEGIRIPSCKMVNTQFSSDNSVDSIKNSYSLQDLESNSGLGLASLPRLDNDIELNFPEVNQQFINANKGDSFMSHSLGDLPTLEVLDQGESSIKDNFGTTNSINRKSEISKSPCAVETEKEFSKLSKYRKGKVNSSDTTDNLKAVRTDSVIIKNPENIKNCEENLISGSNFVNKDMTSIQKSPMNLTSQGTITDKIDYNSTSINLDETCLIQGTKENAIDFSLNKNNTNDFNENSSSFETENADLSRLKESELPELDSIETSNFESILANHSIEQTIDDTSNDKNQIENTSSVHNSPVVDNKRPKCVTPVSCTENAMNINKKQECLSPIATIKEKEHKKSLVTKTSSTIECIRTVDNYAMDIDENIEDVSDQLDVLKYTFEKRKENDDNSPKQDIKDENVDHKDIINNITPTLQKQKNNEKSEEFSEFSNTEEIISGSDVRIPKSNDLYKVCNTEIVGSSCGVQSNDLTQPQISQTESDLNLSPLNNNVRHSVDNYQSKTVMEKSSMDLLASNIISDHKPSDCQIIRTEMESVCDTDFISASNRVSKLESDYNLHLEDMQKLGSNNSKLETTKIEQENDSDLDLPFSNNEMKYISDWKSDMSEIKSYCSLSSPKNIIGNAPKDNLSAATQSEIDFNSSNRNICKENESAVEFSKDNLTDLLDEISNCPMDLENTSDKYYEDVTYNNYEEKSYTHSIEVPVKDQERHAITSRNDELRYLSCGSKKMYSPWIQKLIVTREGCVGAERKDVSDNASTSEQVLLTQETERLEDPCNFECTLKENNISIIVSNINNIVDCTNQSIEYSFNKDNNISEVEYENINDTKEKKTTQEALSEELKSHDIEELGVDSILENKVESISDKIETSNLKSPIGMLISVAQVQSITNNEEFKVEEEPSSCTWSEKSEMKDKNCPDDTPEQWDKVSDHYNDKSNHFAKVSHCDKISEYPNKQLNFDDEGLSVRFNQTNKQAKCFVKEPDQKLQQYECNLGKVTEHYSDNDGKVLEQIDQSVSNNIMLQESDNQSNTNQSKYKLHPQSDKQKCCDDNFFDNLNKNTHFNDDIPEQSDSQSHCNDEMSERKDTQSPCNNEAFEQLDKQSNCIDEMPAASDTHSVGNEIIEQADKLSEYIDKISDESGKGSNDKDKIRGNLTKQSSKNNESFHRCGKQSKSFDEYPKESDKQSNDKVEIFEQLDKQSNYNVELSDQLNEQSICINKICEQWQNPSRRIDALSEQSNKQSDFENTTSQQSTDFYSNHNMISEQKEVSKGNADFKKECSDRKDKEFDCNKTPKPIDKESNSKDDICERLNIVPHCTDKILGPYDDDSNCKKSIIQQVDNQSNKTHDIIDEFNQQSDCNDEIPKQYDEKANSNNEIGEQLDNHPSKPDSHATAEAKGQVVQKSNESASDHRKVDQCNCACNNDIVFEQSPLQYDCKDDILKELDSQSDSSNMIHELQNKEPEMNNAISQRSENHSTSILTSVQCVQSGHHDEIKGKSKGEPDCNNDISEQNISVFNDTEIESSRDDLFCPNEPSIGSNRSHKNRQSLKRSLSDSALNVYNDKHSLQENETNIPLIWPFKRRKINNLDNDILAQNLCNIIHSNRRNSIASFYNEENVSFCILIDNSCIIAEEQESDEHEKICYTELSEEAFEAVQNDCINNENKNVETTVDMALQEESYCEYPESFVTPDEEENLEESWVEDVACVETVISDDIAEDIEISEASSPKDYILSDNEESDIFGNIEHTDKVKYIYGDKMCNDDAQFVETLYNTPQMNVNKTLIQRENLISGEFYDKDSLEKILSESIEPELPLCVPVGVKAVCSPGTTHNKENIKNEQNMHIESTALQNIQNAIEFVEINVDENMQENASEKLFDETQDDTIHSCESSVDNVLKYKENDENTNQITSSSPEVSSTTSEEKGSAILLKITNYKGSRVSQVNNVRRDTKRPSCKFTEEEDYGQSQSNYSAHRPLLTKAAQKYIPPLKESIRDLKVKLPLPQHSLIKLKQLKKSKDETKTNKPNNPVPRISKKPKPKFEDVLKSIDEMQYEMHSKKSPKKSKKSIPKVVIKKNENGSHYASTSNKEEYNPDLTGSKWQPWVFIEKNDFIDNMAIRNKTKAIYSHRKKTYVLAEKFQKYKSVNSAKFVISPPISDRPSGLKYTIRLKHSY